MAMREIRYTFRHLTTTALQYFTSVAPDFRHSTPYHISHISLIPPDHISHGVMWIAAWCGIWCHVECFTMPDVECCALIHPNVDVMWNQVRCRICAIWSDAKCDVMQCQV